MAERWKATTDLVVGDKAIKAGEVFTADEAQVADAVARGLVTKAPANGRRKQSDG
jgi:hypothetical protein